MTKFTKTHSKQKVKSKIKKRAYKKAYRYPHKIFFLIDDNLFGSCTQNHETFLSNRKMQYYLRTLKKGGYISPQGYDVLSKRRHWFWWEESTIFITGRLKLHKHDIQRLYNL